MKIKQRTDPEAELCTLLDRLPNDAAEIVAQRIVRATHGIEFGMESVGADPSSIWAARAYYVNRGDTYATTLVRMPEGWTVSCWGDALTVLEAEHAEETGETRCPYCGEWCDHPGTPYVETRFDCDEIHRGGYGADFLRAEYRSARDTFDPWGTAMGALFDIASELDRRGAYIPYAWQYRAGILGAPDREADAYGFTLATYLASNAALEEVGDLLDRWTGILRVGGHSY